MKKLTFIFIVFFIPKVQAAVDYVGSMRPTLWRSSRTCASPQNFVLLATGTIHWHAVVVETPTVNTDSFVSIFNATATPVGGYNPTVSTAIFHPTVYNTAQSTGSSFVDMSRYPKKTEYDIPLSSGALINKIGGASCIEMQWDFMPPKAQYHLVPFTP